MKHPYFETFAQKQRAEFRDDIAEYIRAADDARKALATIRVLPVNVQHQAA